MTPHRQHARKAVTYSLPSERSTLTRSKSMLPHRHVWFTFPTPIIALAFRYWMDIQYRHEPRR